MLSLFVFQAKPSLADQNVILVFVLGGINGLEVNISFISLSHTHLTRTCSLSLVLTYWNNVADCFIFLDV